MVIVAVTGSPDWSTSNWVFGQVVRDFAAMFPASGDLIYLVEQAAGLGLLDFDALSPEESARLAQALAAMVQATLDGQVGGWRATVPHDFAGIRMYEDALRELADLLAIAQRGGEEGANGPKPEPPRSDDGRATRNP